MEISPIYVTLDGTNEYTIEHQINSQPKNNA